jgi:hypothetical protein
MSVELGNIGIHAQLLRASGLGQVCWLIEKKLLETIRGVRSGKVPCKS